MKLKLLIPIIFLFLNVSYAQYDTLKVDSLKMAIKEHVDLDTTKVNMLTDLARMFNTPQSYEKMLPLISEAMEISEKLAYRKGIGYSNNAMAAYSIYKKDHQKVVEYSLEALAAFENIEVEQSDKIVSYSNLGVAYKNLKEYDKAIDIYLKIYDEIKNLPLSDFHMSVPFHLALNYKLTYKVKEAFKWANILLENAEKMNSTRGKLYAYDSLGELYGTRNQNPTKGLEYINKGLELVDSIQNKGFYYKLIFTKAQINFSARNYKEAISDYETSIRRNEEIQFLPGLEEIYNILFRVYLEMGEDDKAYEARAKAHEYTSEILEEKNRKTIKELEVKYETEKITREKEIAEDNAKLNRNLLVVALVGILLLLILAYVFFRQQQLKRKAEIVTLELKETKGKLDLERKLRDSELKALKAQMNPHFLFNAFNSIQEYIILNKKELASDYLGKFADLMRLYLDHSREKSILLEDEIKAADLYLQLEKIRFEDELDFNITVSSSINEDMMYIPPMLIQPFIENALKHGLFHKEGDKMLEIDFDKKDGVLICSITDNGIGRKEAALINKKRLKKHQSFATAATQSRIELLNIGREEDINFTILDLEDENGIALGTKIILSIPAK